MSHGYNSTLGGQGAIAGQARDPYVGERLAKENNAVLSRTQPPSPSVTGVLLSRIRETTMMAQDTINMLESFYSRFSGSIPGNPPVPEGDDPKPIGIIQEVEDALGKLARRQTRLQDLISHLGKIA